MTQSDPKEIDPRELRNAFGAFMTGVTVVTTVDKSGIPLGFTANSFSSVSMAPPLLSVCPGKFLSSFEAFNQCDYFNVSILAHDQQSVSNVFASSSEERFSQVKWHTNAYGVPVIDGAIASFSCQRVESISAGDHIILLGEVKEFEHREGLGLGYTNGGYFSLDMERKASELQATTQPENQNVIVGALIENNDALFIIHDHDQASLPQISLSRDEPTFDLIKQHASDAVGEQVNIGSVYSVFDSQDRASSYIYYHASVDSTASTIQDKLLKKSSPGQFINIDQLPISSFKSNAIASMISRYVSEYHTGNHNLYIGDELQGKTHKIHGSRS